MNFTTDAKINSVTAIRYAFEFNGQILERTVYSLLSPEAALKALANRRQAYTGMIAYGLGTGEIITADASPRRLEIRKRGFRRCVPSWCALYAGAFRWIEYEEE